MLFIKQFLKLIFDTPEFNYQNAAQDIWRPQDASAVYWLD